MKGFVCGLLLFFCFLFINTGLVLAQETQYCSSTLGICVDKTSITWLKSDVPGALNYPVIRFRGSRDFANAEKTPAIMEVSCISDSSVNRFRTVAVWDSEGKQWSRFDSRWSGGNSDIVKYVCNLGMSRG